MCTACQKLVARGGDAFILGPGHGELPRSPTWVASAAAAGDVALQRTRHEQADPQVGWHPTAGRVDPRTRQGRQSRRRNVSKRRYKRVDLSGLNTVSLAIAEALE